MKNSFTTTSAWLGLLAAAMATGCGAGDPGASTEGPTGDGTAGIVAVGPATVSGCNFNQTFAVSSPQAIDWLANQFDNLSNVQMQLYNINSSGQRQQVMQNAQSASQQLCAVLDNATQSLASNQSASNSFNNAAAYQNQTTMRSQNQAVDSIGSVNGIQSQNQSNIASHHDDTMQAGSQYANGMQSSRSFGDNVANSYGSANRGQSAFGSNVAQNANNASAFNGSSTAAQNANNASTSQTAANGANTNGYQSNALGTASPWLGLSAGGFGTLGQNVSGYNAANAVRAANGVNAAQSVNDSARNASSASAAQNAQSSAAHANQVAGSQRVTDQGTTAIRNGMSGSQSIGSHNTADTNASSRDTIISNTTTNSQRAAMNQVATTVGSTANQQATGNSALSSAQNAASSMQNQTRTSATASNTLAYGNLGQMDSRNMLLQVTGQVTGNNASMKLFQGTGNQVLSSGAFPIAAPSCF